MLFLGYDPGGKGTHGVAAVRVAPDGALAEVVAVDVVQDAEAAWKWMTAHTDAVALGIDTLLAWSPRGGRACDDRLRQAYKAHAPTVIPQNALYSSMTLNGAMVARWAARNGLPLFESHPKLLVRTRTRPDRSTETMIVAYRHIKESITGSAALERQADDKADAVVAAWCAAQGFLGLWPTNLFDAPGDRLELVAENSTYPWPDRIAM